MNSVRKLPEEAEKIRREIKEMIMEAEENPRTGERAIVDCLRSPDGRVMYAGQQLVDKVATLRDRANINPKTGFTCWHLPRGKDFSTEKSPSIHIIPLSESSITSKDTLAKATVPEGTVVLITNNSILSPDTKVIVFME